LFGVSSFLSTANLWISSKTDEIDTLAIVETIRFGRYKPSRVPQDKLLALRELCRNRYYLIDIASDLKRKITALLNQVFPEPEAQFSTVFGKSALAVLKQYPTAEKLARAQLGKLTELLQTASNGRFGEWKARQLKEAAKGSFGIPDCEGVYATLILLHLQHLQSLLDSTAALDQQMAEALPIRYHPYLHSRHWPCARCRNSQRDPRYFQLSSADKLVSYAGLDPRVKQSRETKFGGIHMSKRGSPYLRRAIWMACSNAVQCDPMFRACYEKKAAEGMKYMCIIGHVIRKMTAVIFAVLRDNKAYQPILSMA